MDKTDQSMEDTIITFYSRTLLLVWDPVFDLKLLHLHLKTVRKKLLGDKLLLYQLLQISPKHKLHVS